MKRIFLAPKGKRLLSRLIDLLIMLIFGAILYFTAVFPNVFNTEKYVSNSRAILNLYDESGLFVVNIDNGQCEAKSNFKADIITTLDKLTDFTITIGGKVFDHNNLAKDLYIYYTTGLDLKYDGSVQVDYASYKTNILKVGTEESNIADFVIEGEVEHETYKFVLMDESKASTTIAFFIKQYEAAATTVNNASVIKNIDRESNDMIIFTLVMIVPCLAGASFIFDGIVPVFSPYGQTIGKYITHLIVLTSEGHRVKKPMQLFRWLIFFLELAFGIATFGGGLLIPYTMFLFTKKRQTLHDFAAHTVVADGTKSIFYNTPKEEAYITNRLKEKGLDINESINQDRTSSEE